MCWYSLTSEFKFAYNAWFLGFVCAQVFSLELHGLPDTAITIAILIIDKVTY
jgi:hypothetical protein